MLIVGFALYFFIVVPMNKLNARIGGEKIDSEAAEVTLLKEIRDTLKAQQGGSGSADNAS